MFKKCLSVLLALIILFSIITVLPLEASANGAYLLGDANGDDEVDLIDATLIQRVNAGLAVPYDYQYLMQADVDGDGELTIIDVVYIQRWYLEMNVKYPIGEWVNQ